MSGQLWEVVGGADKGGIIVREGKDLKSTQLPDRLPTGSLVREIALEGERLRYELLEGPGPRAGWVSCRLKDADLLVRSDRASPAPPALWAPRAKPAPLGRPMRVLGLHGGGSNENIMKYQAGPLKRVLGKDVEWDFLSGGRPWAFTNEEPPEIMKSLAQGMPFFGWYGVEYTDSSDRPYKEKLFDTSVEFTYSDVDASVDRVLAHIEAKGPFDVILGFSQGCIVTHLVTALLRERGQPVPWRLSVLMNGMMVRDLSYRRLFETPLDVPALMVFGRADEFYEYGRDSQMAMYVDPIALEHDDGHKFPASPPAQAKEIYARIAKEMRWHCGVD